MSLALTRRPWPVLAGSSEPPECQSVPKPESPAAGGDPPEDRRHSRRGELLRYGGTFKRWLLFQSLAEQRLSPIGDNLQFLRGSFANRETGAVEAGQQPANVLRINRFCRLEPFFQQRNGLGQGWQRILQRAACPLDGSSAARSSHNRWRASGVRDLGAIFARRSPGVRSQTIAVES